MIRAGLMRSRIEIQRLNAVSQFQGGGDWVALWKLKARKTHSSAGEKSVNSGEVARSVVKFKVHYRSGITTTCRLLEGAEVYDIVDVENVGGKNRTLILECVHVSRRGVAGR